MLTSKLDNPHEFRILGKERIYNLSHGPEARLFNVI